MENTSLSPKENQGFSRQDNRVETTKENSETAYQIKQGMSPKEIAEVVSDHLIGVVKQQFEAAKREFRERND